MKSTSVKYEGKNYIVKTAGNKTEVKLITPILFMIFGVVAFYFLLAFVASLISFSYTDKSGITHLFSGNGFLIQTAANYHIFFFAFVILLGIYFSKLVYSFVFRSKTKKFKEHLITINRIN